MSIVTACPYCPAKVKVPDYLLGASFGCPKCGNCFTVAPADLLPVKESAPPPPEPERPVVPASVPSPPPALAEDLPWWVTAVPDVVYPSAAPEAPAPAPAPPAPSVAAATLLPPSVTPPPASSRTPLAVFFPEPSSFASDDTSGWLNPWGAAAFVLTSIGSLFAAFAFPRFVTITLAGIGLLMVLAGVMASREAWKIKDTVWLSLGGGGNVLLLLLASFLPSWLSDQWGMDFAVPQPDLNQQIMVSRDNKTVVKDLTGDDWVNAEQHAIRQGNVLARVESVAIAPLPGIDKLGLLITLHIAEVGHLHPILYHGQASGEYPALVRDSRGKELPRQDLGTQAKKAGQLSTVSILASHKVTDLLAFEPPWAGTAYLHLELPAAAWERQGVCKFKIPRTFIRQPKQTK